MKHTENQLIVRVEEILDYLKTFNIDDIITITGGADEGWDFLQIETDDRILLSPYYTDF